MTNSSRLAVFLDIDGTLADIVATPSQAKVPHATRRNVEALARRLDGAVALISGRHLDDIDAMTGLGQIAAAGIHGAQLRTANGVSLPDRLGADLVSRVEGVLADRIGGLSGVFIERKPLSVAVHYRACPDNEEVIVRAARDIVAGHTALKYITGKRVVEILPAVASKGAAIAHFMELEPFKGRIPLFAGDDVTDEDGFMLVNAMDGISIKIGEGPSRAAFGFETAAAFRRWLDTLASAK
ncbi:MAG TPA: trehalose-phosphatase [Hyphomicrobium sp.]|nr:trehalose-phosphatase [Hyphomicrobium sp.]